MAETQKGGEQSMDDILASIRRIISDDPIAPNAAAAGDAGTATDRLVGEDDPEDRVDLDEPVATGLLAGANPADDLSDILEPSAGSSSGAIPVASHAEARDVSAEGATGWSFDAGNESSELSGSLKNKLASLDGRSQPHVSLEPLPSKDDDVSVPSPSVMAAAEPFASRDIAGGSSGIGGEPAQADLKGAGDNATLDAITQSVPGAVKLSEEDVAAIPSVQAVVEQTAAQAQGMSTAAVTGQAMTVDSLISDIRRNEVRAPQKAKEAALTGAADDESQGELTAAAVTVDDAATVPAAAFDMPRSAIAIEGGKTLESLVADALQPMLQEWLDANLPRLVDEKLQAEIARLTRDGKLEIR